MLLASSVLVNQEINFECGLKQFGILFFFCFVLHLSELTRRSAGTSQRQRNPAVRVLSPQTQRTVTSVDCIKTHACPQNKHTHRQSCLCDTASTLCLSSSPRVSNQTLPSLHLLLSSCPLLQLSTIQSSFLPPADSIPFCIVVANHVGYVVKGLVTAQSEGLHQILSSSSPGNK